jgi:Inner membrane protein YgaP-like, transmembrane domain
MLALTGFHFNRSNQMSSSANVGSFDRAIRLIVGVALILAPHLAESPALKGEYALYGLSAVGAILILTAVFSFCPLYRIIGVRTCSKAS